VSGEPSSSEVVRALCGRQGRTLKSLADELGISPQALDTRLRSSSMRVETLSELLGPLGYRVVVTDGDDSVTVTR
jgi:transcriptional regulator with XRE-family HTH domain